jgi:anti-sigma B factor antagonist
MALEIAQREREGIVLLDLKGRITAGDEAGTFRGAFEKLHNLAQYQLILNMLGVEYVDSTGLGALVMCANTVRRAGGVVRLVHVNRRNIELLVMTKIDTIFEVFDDETEAVNSFFPDREIKRFDILAFVQQYKDE